MKKTVSRRPLIFLLVLSVTFMTTCFSFSSPAPRLAGLNDNAVPTNGSFELNAGFIPDPQQLVLKAGGQDYRQIHGVQGWVRASRPDLIITYNSGISRPLYFWVDDCDEDTFLIIHISNSESWYVNDNSSPDNNMGIVFYDPPSGRYAIWVGTYGDNGYYPDCRLNISEREPANWN